jgi:uncharacterized protein HemX
MSDPSDGLMHELINAVRESAERTTEVRADVNRAMALIYQRIIAIESQNTIEASERPKRQRQLDGSIERITQRLDGQDRILEGQDKKLDTLFDQQEQVARSGHKRLWLMVAILVACLFGIALAIGLPR